MWYLVLSLFVLTPVLLLYITAPYSYDDWSKDTGIPDLMLMEQAKAFEVMRRADMK